MTPLNEILSELELHSKAEKTELAYRLISGGFADPDLIIGELGLADELDRRKDAVEEDVAEEFPIDVLLADVPTEKIARYVNQTIKEMH